MLWHKTHPALNAIIMVTFGYSVFAFSDTITKWLAQGFGLHQILATSSLAGLLITGGWVLSVKGWKGFITPKIKWHLWRSLCVLLISFFVVKALPLIPLADFYGIVFLSPLSVLLLSAVFLKENIGRHRLWAIIVGFAGVIILAGPQFNHMNEGLLFAFLAMLLISTGIILIRKTGHDYLPLYGFYPSLLIFIVNAPLAVTSFEMPDIHAGLIFLIYSPLILLGQLTMSLGFARAPETAVVAPFHYIQMLWGVLFGYFLFSDIPSLATITGSSLIISSGLYIIWQEHKSHIARQIPEMQT